MRQTRESQVRIDALRETVGDGPWSVDALKARGWSTAALRAAVDAGRLVRLSRGVIGLPGAASSDPWGIRAALLSAPAGAVVSHDSAARLQRLWLPDQPSDLVHLTKPGAVERTHHGVRLHGMRLSSTFVTEQDGIPVTTLARTALDVARGRTLPDALAVVDSAARRIIHEATGCDLRDLRKPHVRIELRQIAAHALDEAFSELWTWPGTVVARGALGLMDPASESPRESRSRAWMHESKLPAPQVAYEVRGASGALYFSEFAWPERRVLGEVDGAGKYGSTEAEVRRALRAERHRQADLEDAGWRVVRWTSVEPRPVVLRRLARALGWNPELLP